MRLTTAALATLTPSTSACVHGVVWAVGDGAAVVKFRRTSGEPVAHATVAVQAPNQPAAIPGGRTDGNPGYFIVDSRTGRTYTVTSRFRNSEAFSIMLAVRRGQELLQRMRGRMTGVTRLLMLALCLQLASPLLNPGIATAGQSLSEARLQADIQASLCHDGSSGQDAGRVPASSLGAGHCIFCLPLSGASVAVFATSTVPAPTFSAATHVVPSDNQAPDGSYPTAARPRAPPAHPRTA